MCDYIDFLSTAAIFVFIVSALPHIKRLYATKSAKDINFPMAFLIAGGNALMFAGALSIRDLYFSANYACQLALWRIIVFLIFKYRR
jgi:hypothetical protein